MRLPRGRGPIELALVRPLGALAELAAHEQQLLAGVRPHEAVQRAQVGELLPLVARHLADQRALAVDDLVVRQRQHEVLAEGVDQREGQPAQVVLAVHRLVLHERERVVHPAHVPLHAEAEAPHGRRPRHHRPGGRFLGDRQRVRVRAVHRFVEPAQEGDGLQVLVAAVWVGDPFAGAPRVVEVQHRRDGVHAQAVDVVPVEPEQRRREQEARDLAAPVVEDPRVPLGVEALARVGVLVQVRAVEVMQPVRVGREMRWHPVEDHADALRVQVIDEVGKVLRRAIAGGRREVAGGLVAPRAVERVLGQRHQLDVREPHAQHVLGQRVRQLAVAHRPPVGPPPRAGVQLVHRDRRVQCVAPRALAHPRSVVPHGVELRDARGRARRQLGLQRERVGLVDAKPAAAGHAVLVQLPGARTRDLAEPHAAVVRRRERVRVGIPVVELAHHRDTLGVGRPQCETRAVGVRTAAQQLVQAAVRPFAEQVAVLVGPHVQWLPASAFPRQPLCDVEPCKCMCMCAPAP